MAKRNIFNLLFSLCLFSPVVASDCEVKPGPLLLFLTRTELRELSLESNQDRIIENGLKNGVGLGYDYDKQRVFISDMVENTIWMNSTDCGTTSVEILVNGTSAEDNTGAAGIAFDWIHDVLYWTNIRKPSIELLTMQGRHRKTLVNSGLGKPRAIAVDPRDDQKWLYWSDWGSKPKIEKVGLDGSNRALVVATNIVWPNGLTIDYDDNRLYWVDAKIDTISSSDLDGQNRRIIQGRSEFVKHPFAISLFEDSMYWTDWQHQAVFKANKNNGSGVQRVAPSTGNAPMDIQVYHKLRQPQGNNPCGMNNGNCSHICLATPVLKTSGPGNGPKFICTCPDDGFLKKDGITCEKPAQPGDG